VTRPLLGRILSFLFAFAVVGFGLLVAWSVLRFPLERLLPLFRGEYALKNGFVLFGEALLPLSAAAVAVAASLARGGAAGQAQPFSRTAGSTVAAFIVLAAAYTFVFEAAVPAARRRLAAMEHQSSTARQLLREAEKARVAGDWPGAREALTRYLAIDKGNKAVQARRLDAETEAARRAVPAKAPSGDQEPPGDVDASSYVEKARYYFDREDWFSAHYYASHARQIDPRRADAARLAALAWQKVVGAEPPASDRQAAALFREKREAYVLLETEPVAAYYRFADLARRHPKDADIAEYFAASTARVQEISFFREEVEQASGLPGARDILFLNPVGADTVEAVIIGSMVDAGSRGVYVMDVEALRMTPAGEVLWHLRAPYGRINESPSAGAGTAGAPGRQILLLAIDRDDRARAAGPVYLAGSRPKAERNILPVAPTVREMEALAGGPGGILAMGLPELWRLRGSLASYGVLRASIETEIVMKAFMPFAFLTLSFLALALGWALRARGLARPPVAALLFVPLVPAAAALASLLYVHAHRIVLGFAVLAFGLTPALVAGAVLALVLLAVSLVLTAGQAS
jgi:hypothetical protein